MDKLLLGILVMLVLVIIRNPGANPIANMYGRLFLLFYGLIIVITLFVCKWSIKYDLTGKLPLPLIPINPDPLEIGYLRGGENEVARLVTFDLIQRGYLKIIGKRVQKSPDYPKWSQLSPLEQEVFSWFDYSKQVSPICEFSVLIKIKEHVIQKHCIIYKQHLQNEQLLFTETPKAFIRYVTVLGFMIILGLGIYKLVMSILQGHSNILFLMIMGVISVINLRNMSQVPVKSPRVSQRGTNYLRQLAHTFANFKEPNINITDLDMLLPLAIFGLTALINTPFSNFIDLFNVSGSIAGRYLVSQSTSGSCESGGGCGGSGGDAGGGGGGCGGGGGGGGGGCGGGGGGGGCGGGGGGGGCGGGGS